MRHLLIRGIAAVNLAAYFLSDDKPFKYSVTLTSSSDISLDDQTSHRLVADVSTKTFSKHKRATNV